MLSAFEKGILELIRCALKGEVPTLEDGFDFDAAYEFAQERQITPLIYYGAVNYPGFMDTIAGKKFFKSTMNLSFYCYGQSDTINSIREAFRQNKIQQLAVKGTIIRDMYPYPEMRLMSDADILIKEEDYPKIKEIMLSLGFTEEYESDHELVWKKDSFSIELHKRLIPSYTKDYYSYFGDGWRLATKRDEETNECFMSGSDSFIYNFIHYAKHYRDGGIGVKHVTDFYVLMNKDTTLDFEYIERELEKLEVLKFWKNTKKMLDVWFNSAPSDEMTDFMTAKIFGSGAYGTMAARLNAEAVRTSNTGKFIKLKKAFSLLFPTYAAMCQKYSFLKKAKILLPVMWVVRWFEALFNPSRIKEQKNNINMIDKQSVDKYKNELDYVGLSFDFKIK